MQQNYVRPQFMQLRGGNGLGTRVDYTPFRICTSSWLTRPHIISSTGLIGNTTSLPVLCCCSLLIAHWHCHSELCGRWIISYSTSLDPRLEHTLGTSRVSFSSVTGLAFKYDLDPATTQYVLSELHHAPINVLPPLLGAWWGLYWNLTEDSTLIVRIWLPQTAVCVKFPVISHLFQGDLILPHYRGNWCFN